MTSSIPLSRDEEHAFTPPSLVNVVPTPIFRFRPATERDQKRFGHLLSLEGLRLFPQDAIRAAMLSVLEKNWSPQIFERERKRLLVIWEKIDQSIDIEASEQEALAELTMRCVECSPLLRQMDADNRRFMDESPGVALSMFLAGWKHVDAEFELEAGRVSYGSMMALQKALKTIEDQGKEDKVADVEPGLAYVQLGLHAFGQLSLGKDEEKNSSAPSQSSETQSGSSTTTQRDGASKGAAAGTSSRRGKTRAKRSRSTSSS